MSARNRYIMLELTPEEAEAVKDAVVERIGRLRDLEMAAGAECFSARKKMLGYVIEAIDAATTGE